MFHFLGSQAGVVDISHAFHLYYKCCMWIEFQSISTWLRGFSPGTPVSSLLKIDSQSNSSGCGAVLRSHIWIVFRGRAPNRQHSSFGPTSLSCALCNSAYGLRERVISRSTILLFNSLHFPDTFRHCVGVFVWAVEVSQVTVSPKRTTESFFTASSKRSCQHIENETAADEGEVGWGGKIGMSNFIFTPPPHFLFRSSVAVRIKNVSIPSPVAQELSCQSLTFEVAKWQIIHMFRPPFSY